MIDKRWMAMVALDEAEPAPLERIEECLRQTFDAAASITEVSTAGNVTTFRLGEAAAAIVLFPMPIPWEHLEGPCACAWYWPPAAEVLRRHRAHALVSLLDERREPLDKAMELTRLVACVARTSDSLGVFWGPSRLVHPPDAVWELAESMSREELPLYLWIDFRVEQVHDGLLRLFTTGMEALGYEELEVSGYSGTADELRAHVFNVAHHVLEKEKRLGDGERIGLSDELQITVRQTTSMVDAQQEVIALQF